MAEALRGAAAGGASVVVLDLRGNGGGSFPAAVDVARQLLPPRSVVVNIADSNGVRDVFDSPGEPLLAATTPLALLVDGGTASAAEVLAGALRDNGRAALLGERTYGKGIIQTTVALSDGSAVNVTLARYQTPSGADIQRIGIAPDAPSPLPSPPPATPSAFCDALTPERVAALLAQAARRAAL
jgi:C-terminal peptidase prc